MSNAIALVHDAPAPVPLRHLPMFRPVDHAAQAPAGRPAAEARCFVFGPFVLIPARQLLMEGDVPIRVGSRALELLTALVERPGELITKQGLMQRAWPDTFVEEGNLKVNMAGLRRILRDCVRPARYIATVIGRGYQFVAPVECFGSNHAVMGGQAADRSGDRGLAAVGPVGNARIVGRAEAVFAIAHEFERFRLVSIVGPEGVGKADVALCVAERWVAGVRDGVWFVDLSMLDDAAALPNAIAAAIGLAAPPANVLAALCGFLKEREALLVLSGCRWIGEAVMGCVDQLLTAAPGVRVLATSRQPLRVPGERVFRLPAA